MPVQKTDLTTKIEKLKALEAEALKLQNEIVDQRPVELAGLYAAYGFSSVGEFIKAVKAARDITPARKAGRPSKKNAKVAKKTTAKKPGKRGRPKKATAVAETKGKRPRGRVRITDEVKSKVKQLIADGKSGVYIAKTLKISLPSVQNIKKDAGLVKSRAGRAVKVKSVTAEIAVAPAAPEAPVVNVATDVAAN